MMSSIQEVQKRVKVEIISDKPGVENAVVVVRFPVLVDPVAGPIYVDIDNLKNSILSILGRPKTDMKIYYKLEENQGESRFYLGGSNELLQLITNHGDKIPKLYVEIAKDQDQPKPIVAVSQLVDEVKVPEPQIPILPAKPEPQDPGEVAQSPVAVPAVAPPAVLAPAPLPSILKPLIREDTPKVLDEIKSAPVSQANTPAKPKKGSAAVEQLELMAKTLKSVTEERDQSFKYIKILQNEIEEAHHEIHNLKAKTVDLVSLAESLKNAQEKRSADEIADLQKSLQQVKFLMEENQSKLDAANNVIESQKQYAIEAIQANSQSVKEGFDRLSADLEAHVQRQNMMFADFTAQFNRSFKDHRGDVDGRLHKLESIMENIMQKIQDQQEENQSQIQKLVHESLAESKAEFRPSMPQDTYDMSPQSPDTGDEHEDSGFVNVAMSAEDLKKSLTDSRVQYAEQLADLEKLGFTESGLNSMLLNVYGGNLEKTISELTRLKKQHIY